MNEQEILGIAADHVDRDGYVAYAAFGDLKPNDGPANLHLHSIKHCLLENGYLVHERQHRAQWRNCGFPRDHTHFHRN